MSLIQTLPDGDVDIVGDIHGEIDALRALLRHLGYDEKGAHRTDRRLVFVGDLCDRGPDSPAVIRIVKAMVETGRAHMVLGNHEMNLLQDDAKDGSGWYFPAQAEDDVQYAPFARVDESGKADIRSFLAGLPIGLERSDLRVVHAAWRADDVARIRAVPLGGASEHFRRWQEESVARLKRDGTHERYVDAKRGLGGQLKNKEIRPGPQNAIATYDVATQMNNPLKVLTSGVEQMAAEPFFSSNKWRFAERVPWWKDYPDETSVVVGHYWRSRQPIDRNAIGKGGPDLFDGVGPKAWHGKRKNVFCVDFSVGKRYRERKSSPRAGSDFHLAALRWPERTVRFDTGDEMETDGFQEST